MPLVSASLAHSLLLPAACCLLTTALLLPPVDPKDPDAVPEATIPGLDVTLSDIQDALRGARERVDEARVAAMDEMSSGPGANLLRGPLGSLLARGEGAEVPSVPKLPSLQDLAKSLNLTELAARATNITSLAELAKQLNVSSLNPAELAKLNITSVGELLRGLNASAALPPIDVAATIGKVGERVMSLMPRLPDPLYMMGLRLDPKALADADLPAVATVPQLFGSLMSQTMGEAHSQCLSCRCSQAITTADAAVLHSTCS
jgi:hypothetical protein